MPEETARVAHAIFPQGHLYLTLRDELGHIFSDLDFAPLFPRRGQPAEAPWCLALVSVLQYAENLSDRQAAHAVRSRIDWKYLLGLALTDTGFDASVLSEFRSRVVTGSREQEVLNTLLNHCRERQWLSARGRQRTDSTHVLGMIRALNRLECVGETMRHALNSLATVAPDWLVAHSDPDWIERYGHRVEDYRLPKDKQERSDYGGQIGKDGYSLLAAVAAADAPAWLAQVPAVETLRQVWVQQYYCCETAIQWRTETEGFPPASHMINSPYDPEAHDAKKRTTTWVGYRVHLTESCDENRPHIITHVETTAAPTADGDTLRPSTKDCSRRTCSRIGIWSTPGMSMPTFWSRAERDTASSCMVPPARTPIGRPVKPRASLPTSSRSTGTSNRRPVRADVAARAGPPPRMPARPQSRSNSLVRIAPPAPVAGTAPRANTAGVPSRCARTPNTKHSGKPASVNRRKTLLPSMGNEPGSKGPCHKECGRSVCGERAMWGSRRHTSSTSSSPARSIWCGWAAGWLASRRPIRGNLVT